MSVKNLISGWGINDANYSITNCYIYTKWKDMIYRAFPSDKNIQRNRYRYEGISIDSKFQKFMDFREWCLSQGLSDRNRNILQIDKDILKSGNKHYSPELCVLVPGVINSCLLLDDAKRTNLPIGVTRVGKSMVKYQCYISTNGVNRKIAKGNNPNTLHKMWQKEKAEQLSQKANEYLNLSVSYGYVYRQDVYDALIQRSIKITNDCENNIQTTYF